MSPYGSVASASADSSSATDAATAWAARSFAAKRLGQHDRRHDDCDKQHDGCCNRPAHSFAPRKDPAPSSRLERTSGSDERFVLGRRGWGRVRRGRRCRREHVGQANRGQGAAVALGRGHVDAVLPGDDLGRGKRRYLRRIDRREHCSVVPPRPRAGHGLRFRHLDAVIGRTRTTRVVVAVQQDVTGTRLGRVIFRHHVCAIVRKEHGGLIVGLQPHGFDSPSPNSASISPVSARTTDSPRCSVPRLRSSGSGTPPRSSDSGTSDPGHPAAAHHPGRQRSLAVSGIGTSALDGQVFRLRCTCCVLGRVRRRRQPAPVPSRALSTMLRGSFIRREERIEVCRHGVRSRLRRLRARVGAAARTTRRVHRGRRLSRHPYARRRERRRAPNSSSSPRASGVSFRTTRARWRPTPRLASGRVRASVVLSRALPHFAAGARIAYTGHPWMPPLRLATPPAEHFLETCTW